MGLEPGEPGTQRGPPQRLFGRAEQPGEVVAAPRLSVLDQKAE
ncbi:hypothetical protein ACFYWY_37665 [Streptomyces sp. NPDC002870]